MKICQVTITFIMSTLLGMSCTRNHTNRTMEERASFTESPIIKTTAADLIAEFTKNTEAAIKKYEGKTIQITGEVLEKASPKDNIPTTNASYIVFGEYRNGDIYIQCYFDEVVVDRLQQGDTLTVTGDLKRFNDNKSMRGVILEKGVIQKVKPKHIN